jgi:hypothetical protein
VEQLRTISGEIRVSDGKLFLKTSFQVKVADHKIEVPTLVFEKIAEEIKVMVETDYSVN